jgi:hypothetical protein
MGWPSTFEDIQERRDEAEYFRRAAGVVEMPQPDSEPARRPGKKLRIDWDWLRWSTLKKKWGFFPTIDSVVWRPGQQPYRGSFNVGTFDKGCLSGAVQFDFHGIPKSDSEYGRLSARIGARDFPTLIQAMLLANEQATLDAIKKALHRSDSSVS